MEEASVRLTSFLKTEDNIAIIGLGNEFKTDDGAGIAVIRLLQKNKKRARKKKIFLIEAKRNLINYLSIIKKYSPSRILFVDAVNMNKKAGKLMILFEAQITEREVSTHTNNLLLSLTYLKKMIPNCLFLFLGIQYGHLGLSEKLTLTTEVRKGVLDAVQLIESISKKERTRFIQT